jgi:uncharacterized protein
MASPSVSTRARRFAERPLPRLVLGLAWLLVVLGVANVATGWVKGVFEPVASAVVALAGLAAYAGFVRLLERRAATELSPTHALPEGLAGVGLGTLLFSATIGVIALAGGYRVEGTHALSAVPPALAMAITSAVGEELLLRGIVFRITQELLGTWGALIISAALFGALHLLNPNATGLAAVAISLEAGVLLGAAFQATRRLWLPIGLHAGWNFTQGGLFGVSVSGTDVTGVLQGSLAGPTWLTGGAFGPEASVVAVVICLFGALPLLWLAVRRGNWVTWSARGTALA